MKGSFALFAVAALACATYPAAGSAADDTAALRAELDALKSEYDARVAALEARIGQLESAAVAAAPAPAVSDVPSSIEAAPVVPIQEARSVPTKRIAVFTPGVPLSDPRT